MIKKIVPFLFCIATPFANASGESTNDKIQNSYINLGYYSQDLDTVTFRGFGGDVRHYVNEWLVADVSVKILTDEINIVFDGEEVDKNVIELGLGSFYQFTPDSSVYGLVGIQFIEMKSKDDRFKLNEEGAYLEVGYRHRVFNALDLSIWAKHEDALNTETFFGYSASYSPIPNLAVGLETEIKEEGEDLGIFIRLIY